MSKDAAISATHVVEDAWPHHPDGYRAYQRTIAIGHGDDDWKRASAAVLRWEVKTHSGFTVQSRTGTETDVKHGADYTLIASIGPLRIREPITVVAVVNNGERCGFAYATRPGHPITGEEAFIVHRTADGRVWFTLRSLTKPGLVSWRLAFPVILVAQGIYRRRYLRAMRHIARQPSR